MHWDWIYCLDGFNEITSLSFPRRSLDGLQLISGDNLEHLHPPITQVTKAWAMRKSLSHFVPTEIWNRNFSSGYSSAQRALEPGFHETMDTCKWTNLHPRLTQMCPISLSNSRRGSVPSTSKNYDISAFRKVPGQNICSTGFSLSDR